RGGTTADVRPGGARPADGRRPPAAGGVARRPALERRGQFATAALRRPRAAGHADPTGDRAAVGGDRPERHTRTADCGPRAGAPRPPPATQPLYAGRVG